MGDDPTGIANEILGHAIPSAQANCFQATWTDGTWAETVGTLLDSNFPFSHHFIDVQANYQYFGESGLVEMASTLETSTGTTQGLMESNPSQNLSSLYHIYVSGYNGMFDYGDCGPNKYTATANR
jgi:hypothetical protein